VEYITLAESDPVPIAVVETRLLSGKISDVLEMASSVVPALSITQMYALPASTASNPSVAPEGTTRDNAVGMLLLLGTPVTSVASRKSNTQGFSPSVRALDPTEAEIDKLSPCILLNFPTLIT